MDTKTAKINKFEFLYRDDELKLETILISLIDLDVSVSATSKAQQRSLLKAGQVGPIRLQRLDNGRYAIIDGRRRVANLKATGATEVLTLVQRIDNTTATYQALILNMSRSYSPMTEARLIGKLKAEGHTDKQIAETLGVSKSLVVQRERLLDLHPILQEKLQAGLMTLAAAKQALKLPQSDQQALGESEGKVTVQRCSDVLRSYQAEMIDLSQINIPTDNTIYLTGEQLESLSSGQAIMAGGVRLKAKKEKKL